MKIRKAFTILMSAALLASSSLAFADEESETEAASLIPKTASDQLMGGWSSAEDPAITDEINDLLAKALSGLVGANYEAVAYLGSQVVAGTNHCILCRTTVVYPGALPYYTLVYIYEDLQGNAEITNIVTLDIAELSQPEDDDVEAETAEENGEESEESEAETLPALGGMLLGGWQAVEDNSLTDELTAAFDKALEGLTGVNYVPVADLAYQIVAGTNHCVLCQSTLVYPDALPYYTLIYFYEDLEGGAELTNIVELDIAALSAKAEDEEPEEEPETNEEPIIGGPGLLGGWRVAESSEITDELQDVFSQAAEKLLGVNYEPVAYLASQVVAGTNHCFLCRATVVYPGAVPGYVLVYIYEDLQGGAEITQIAQLDIAGLSQPEIEE